MIDTKSKIIRMRTVMPVVLILKVKDVAKETLLAAAVQQKINKTSHG